MQEFLQSISSTTCDDVKLFITTQAHCWKAIVACLCKIEKYIPAIKASQIAIITMESKLGEECKKLEVYAICCQNAGFLYKMNDQPDESESFCVKAIIAHQAAEDVEQEEWKIKRIHSTIHTLCNLYQAHPSMKKKKGSDVYHFLRKQEHLTGFPRFRNDFLTLRLMILLNLDDDVKPICKNLATMATNITPPPGECNDICSKLNKAAKLLFSKNEEQSAISLRTCVMKLSEFILNPYNKFWRIYEFIETVSDLYSQPTASQLVTIELQIIPLCEEVISKIKEFRNIDQQIKDKGLSLALDDTSQCYLKVKGYDKALQLSKQALEMLPLDIGQDQSHRDFLKGRMLYCIGVSNYKLKKYDLAIPALSEAIELFGKYSGQNDRIKEARRYLEKINKPSFRPFRMFGL
ncbi:uncharacterized protein LOC143470551 [Clavelina lepadiformis]